jgi:hypothetical protein
MKPRNQVVSCSFACRPVAVFVSGYKVKATILLWVICKVGWNLHPTGALLFAASRIPCAAPAGLLALEAALWLGAAAFSSSTPLDEKDPRTVSHLCNTSMTSAVQALGKDQGLEPFLLLEQVFRSACLVEPRAYRIDPIRPQ